MNRERCDQCGEKPDRRNERTESIVMCAECGYRYCTDCLERMAITSGIMDADDAERMIDMHGIAGLLCRDKATGFLVCPECFEANQ